ncbi:hypothetical protein M405DRAFT_633777 [Rhizopogon salebrosus TDB-379]|nr:hypothetical protein M405DRAFT_633777 [Rhizopogon salebrosus TDB-379]
MTPVLLISIARFFPAYNPTLIQASNTTMGTIFNGDTQLEVVTALANCGDDIDRARQAIITYVVRKQKKGRTTNHILVKLRHLEMKFINDTSLHIAFRDARALTCLPRSLDLPLSTQSLSAQRDTTILGGPNLRQQYISPSDAEGGIRGVIDTQMQDAPPRILNTTTGRLCDRKAQINAFKASTEYKELLSFTINQANLRMKRIQDVVATFFQYVMLSHRWEGKEPLLHDIQDKSVYDLNPIDGNVKLQCFCRAARDAGYQWAWSDTCCIDKNNNVEVQESINSMFILYRHSALTIVYLSDVLPSSVAGGLTKSAWNTRGWTVQEYLAPKVVLFYQKDWTLYLDDHSLNHKESPAIMQELGYATGIDTRALIAFRQGMRGAREKLQWASMRVTTLQEDVSYSLFGLFDVHLPVIYGERKQNALGRLLQEIVARSGDISALDWIGKSSQFNSCLPAEIMSYRDPPYTPPSPSEDEIQISVSLLRNSVAVDLASELYTLFCNLRASRFGNCRLHLPCIAFPVTEVRRRAGHDRETHLMYEVKTDGLNDLLITTEEKLVFSRARPTR